MEGLGCGKGSELKGREGELKGKEKRCWKRRGGEVK